MKLTLTTLTLITFANVPAFASTLSGCELIDKGGYFNLVDPTCLSDGGRGEDRIGEPKEDPPTKS